MHLFKKDRMAEHREARQHAQQTDHHAVRQPDTASSHHQHACNKDTKKWYKEVQITKEEHRDRLYGPAYHTHLEK